MKYPGDIVYFLKFVGRDILIVAAAVLFIVIVSTGFFLSCKGKKKRD